MKNMATLIIGTGPVGLAFASALKTLGVPVLGVASRNPEKAVRIARKFGIAPCRDYSLLLPEARFILLAVKDSAIHEVAQKLHESGKIRKGAFLAHTSGALDSSVLKGNRGVFVFSLHPLQSFPRTRNTQPQTLRGVPLVFEGDRQAKKFAKTLARTLEGKFIPIPRKFKTLYHAAACLAGNFSVALAAAAARLNQKAGIPKSRALSILFPLMEGTVGNLKKYGIPEALTGPVQRGDSITVQKHLKALEKISKEWARLYRLLSLETLKIAKEKGLNRGEARVLKRLLKNSL